MPAEPVPAPRHAPLIYFSNTTENTHRFVLKLDVPARRIPLLTARAGEFRATEPFVLITPTYGGGSDHRAVPRQVIAFLNVPGNRALLRGVITGGNTSFGHHFGLAGRIVAAKCEVPLLHTFEILGTPDDVLVVRTKLETIA